MHPHLRNRVTQLISSNDIKGMKKFYFTTKARTYRRNVIKFSLLSLNLQKLGEYYCRIAVATAILHCGRSFVRFKNNEQTKRIK